MRKRREMIGTVLGRRMDKTAVVLVDRRAQDTAFKKTVRRQSRFKAHDSKNECRAGDTVLIQETRPLSREKKWLVSRVLRRGFEETTREDSPA